MTFDEIKKLLKEKGIVGAGGAGFPTYAKLSYEVNTIILNGAECEPLFRVDQNLIKENAYSILKGLDYLVEAVGAKEGIISIKEHYNEASLAIDEVIYKFPRLRKVLLKDGYPAGDEVILVYEVTGLVVSQGEIPINVGVMVINVETVLNVFNAVENNKPVTYKYLTLGGAVNNPKTLKVPIGTKIKDLLLEVDGITINNYKILIGGPMTGKIGSLNDTVSKTTKGIFILPADNPVIELREYNLKIALKRSMGVCSQCRMCTDLCPRNLLGHSIEPHKIMNSLAFGLDYNLDVFVNALGCCECNICSAVACHQNLNPMGIILELKSRLRSKGLRLERKQGKIKEEREYSRFPLNRVIGRLGLSKYNVDAPISEMKKQPNKVELSLRQSIGEKVKPLVIKGEKVIEGQLIGQVKDSELGVFLHSSIKGIVEEVNIDSIIIRRDE